jgi:hypothetical protein
MLVEEATKMITMKSLYKLAQIILKSGPQQWADCSSPFYTKVLVRVSNPANGSWRIVQVLTKEIGLEVSAHYRGRD